MLPMKAGSGAKVLLAYADTATQQAVLPDREIHRPDTGRGPETRLGAERRRTRARGGQCLGTGARRRAATVIAAVSVSGPIDRMGRRPGARWAADLLAAADALTRRL